MKRLPGVLAALCLAACQPAPFVKPEVPVPAGWPHQAPPTAEGESLARQPWMAVFPVPELAALIDEALAGGSDLRIALERVEHARAQFGLERAARFPAVSATAAVARERVPGLHPTDNRIGESGALSLNLPAWEIDLWVPPCRPQRGRPPRGAGQRGAGRGQYRQ